MSINRSDPQKINSLSKVTEREHPEKEERARLFPHTDTFAAI